MMKVLLPFSLFLLVAGVVLGYFWGQQTAREPDDATVGSSANTGRIEQLQRDLRASDRNLAAAQVELSRLRNELDRVRASRETALDAGVDAMDGAEIGRQERMQEARAERMAVFYQRRARSLANRLGLDEEQEAALAGMMAEQGWLGRGRGLNVDATNGLDAGMAELLDDDQYERWQAYQAEEAQVRAETFANVELGRLSLLLGLDEQQKDQVFERLYEEAIQVDQGDLRNTRINRRERLDSLRQVLTPEQQEAYESTLNTEAD